MLPLEEDMPIKEKESNNKEYSGQFRLRLPKSLHKHLAERAKAEGVSLNQFCVYVLSQANER